MSALWTIAANPRRRARKGRSAAQKAATRRMLAANRARSNPRRRKARKSTAPATVHHARRVTRRTVRRSARRSGRSTAMRGIGAGAMALLKAGAVGAGGALAVDVAMGFANGFLPASMNTKLNADGSVNYMNYAAKFGVVLGMRMLASKALSHEVANRMAAGSVTVMAYELLRPMAVGVLPASMSLGWYSPAVTFKAGVRPGMAPGMGNYQNLQRMGNYQSTRPAMKLVSPNAEAR